MEAIFELLALVLGVLLRAAVVVIATPLILLWPGRRGEGAYWQTVAARYARLFEWVLS